MSGELGAAPDLGQLWMQFVVHRFLDEEAALLDAHRYRDWLRLLDGAIRYVMAVRVTTLNGEVAPRASTFCHFDENLYSLTKRVERVLGEHAWTENPHSRTRHFVTNVRCGPGDEVGDIRCTSNLLLFRSRLDDRPPEWVSAERDDTLCRVGGTLHLRRREIVVDESVLRTQNLAVFL